MRPIKISIENFMDYNGLQISNWQLKYLSEFKQLMLKTYPDKPDNIENLTIPVFSSYRRNRLDEVD